MTAHCPIPCPRARGVALVDGIDPSGRCVGPPGSPKSPEVIRQNAAPRCRPPGVRPDTRWRAITTDGPGPARRASHHERTLVPDAAWAGAGSWSRTEDQTGGSVDDQRTNRLAASVGRRAMSRCGAWSPTPPPDARSPLPEPPRTGPIALLRLHAPGTCGVLSSVVSTAIE